MHGQDLHRLVIFISSSVLLGAGCYFSDRSGLKPDQFVEFQSRLGNVIVYPAQWKTTDEGDTMTLESPDGHAKLVIWSCTVAGSGSPDVFLETVVGGLEKENGLKRGNPGTFALEGFECTKMCLRGTTSPSSSWNVYTLQSGELYHALMLQATPEVMDINEGFYEEMISSFVGAEVKP